MPYFTDDPDQNIVAHQSNNEYFVLPDLGWIKSDKGNEYWLCACGNDNQSDGFTALSITQAYNEGPRHDSGFTICQGCGRILNRHTHQHAPKDQINFANHQDGLVYRVMVVGFVPLVPEYFDNLA